MTMIIVTGTPATGKTTLAKKIASDKGYRYIDVNSIIEEKGLSTGYDEARDCKIIDTDRLIEELLKIDGDVVIDSHLSHNMPKDKVDRCIVTKCPLPTLKKRLEERGYSEEKIRENLDAEILDVCEVEARENGHEVEIVVT